MFEIAGGILIAVFVLMTMELWLPFAIWAAIAAVVTAASVTAIVGTGIGLQAFADHVGHDTASADFIAALAMCGVALLVAQNKKEPGFISTLIRTAIYGVVVFLSSLIALLGPSFATFVVGTSVKRSFPQFTETTAYSAITVVVFAAALITGFALLGVVGRNLGWLKNVFGLTESEA